MMEKTPSLSGIEFLASEFETVCDALDYAAQGYTGLNFYSHRGELEAVLSYRELRRRALDVARRLSLETQPNDLVGLVAQTGPDFAVMFFACQYAGVLPVPVQAPAALGGHQAYKDQIRKIGEAAKFHSVLSPPETLGLLQDVFHSTRTNVGRLSGADLPKERGMLRPFGANDLCYVQFSSGSTSDPKGILGSQRSVTANCRAIRTGLDVRPGDRISSWLPLYHDMGLIGHFIAPITSQLSVDYLDPKSFARRPSTWLKLISENKATVSFSPSFGYEVCAKRWRAGAIDLSNWRVAGIGGDMVQSHALEQFAETFSTHGFSPQAFVPSYGLAEATLAVSFSKLNDNVIIDHVDKDVMRNSQQAVPTSCRTGARGSRSFIGCGKTISEHEVMVCDEEGRSLSERRVGRILFRGESVAPGVLNPNGAIMPLADENGWLDTGDLGYWLGDELVVTGRHKDLILWNGRNIWPQDIEWVAETAGGRLIHKSAAFKLSDELDANKIILLAECRTRDGVERTKLVKRISATLAQSVGVPVSVVLVPLRSLIVTSSGKLSRMRTRTRYLEGGYDEEAPRIVEIAAV